MYIRINDGYFGKKINRKKRLFVGYFICISVRFFGQEHARM